LEWKIIYVGSAEDSQYDQLLEEVLVGPVAIGINKFILQAPAPDYSRIKNEDLLGVTVTLVTCSYVNQEFVRVGYYVNNDYSEPFDPLTPPNPVDVNKLFRNILANEPRVTRFAIDWSGNSPQAPIEGGPEEEVPINESEEAVDFEKMEEDDDDDDNDEDSEDSGDENAEVDLGDESDRSDDEGNDQAENEDDEEGDANDEAGDDVAEEMVDSFIPSTTIPINEDSMDVGMMQHYVDTNNLSHQGIF
jgi:histone chaperone ASF1